MQAVPYPHMNIYESREADTGSPSSYHVSPSSYNASTSTSDPDAATSEILEFFAHP